MGTTVLFLYAALKRASKIRPIIALAQPFLGIMLIVATKKHQLFVISSLLAIRFFLSLNLVYGNDLVYGFKVTIIAVN